MIENWSGDIIDYEKNGQVSYNQENSNKRFRFAKYSMDRVLASLKMVMSIKANFDTVFFTERELLNGLTELYIKENSVKTKSLEKATTLGLMEALTEVKFLMA